MFHCLLLVDCFQQLGKMSTDEHDSGSEVEEINPDGEEETKEPEVLMTFKELVYKCIY